MFNECIMNEYYQLINEVQSFFLHVCVLAWTELRHAGKTNIYQYRKKIENKTQRDEHRSLKYRNV